MKNIVLFVAMGSLLSSIAHAKTQVTLDCQLIEHDIKQYEREANFLPLTKRSLYHLHIVRGMLSTQRREMFGPLPPIEEDVSFHCQQALSPKQFEEAVYHRDFHRMEQNLRVDVAVIPFIISLGEKVALLAKRLFKRNLRYCRTPRISKNLHCTDCSFIPFFSYRTLGRKIPRTASSQCSRRMKRVNTPKAGDIACFSATPYGPITHSGLMLDSYTLLHATVRKGVLMHSVSNWTQRKRKYWFKLYFRYYTRP